MNLAIILAMAGMDYSQVIEPLWEERMSATEPRVLEYIGRLAEKIHSLVRRPDRIDHGYERKDGFWTRQRTIYYDTDGIRERQQEQLFDCSACPGFLVIRSAANGGRQSLIVESPRGACPACRQRAEDLYRRAVAEGKPAEYGDRAADVYERNF